MASVSYTDMLLFDSESEIAWLSLHVG